MALRCRERAPSNTSLPDLSRCSNYRQLFDHLVGTTEQRDREGEAERLRGLESDNELKFHRLLDRQGGRFFAFENPRGVATGETIGVHLAAAVTHQSTNIGKLAQKIDCGHRMARRQPDQLITPTDKQ